MFAPQVQAAMALLDFPDRTRGLLLDKWPRFSQMDGQEERKKRERSFIDEEILRPKENPKSLVLIFPLTPSSFIPRTCNRTSMVP